MSRISCLLTMLTITLGTSSLQAVTISIAGDYPGNVAPLATATSTTSSSMASRTIDLLISNSSDTNHLIFLDSDLTPALTLTWGLPQTLSQLIAIVNFPGDGPGGNNRDISSMDFQLDTGSGFSSVGVDSTFTAVPANVAAIGYSVQAKITGSFSGVLAAKFVATPNTGNGGAVGVRISEAIAIAVPEPSGICIVASLAVGAIGYGRLRWRK